MGGFSYAQGCGGVGEGLFLCGHMCGAGWQGVFNVLFRCLF